MNIPRRRLAATPRLRRGYSAETSRGDAAAATRIFPRRRVAALRSRPARPRSYYDDALQISLARKLCERGDYNEVAATQLDKYAALRGYAGTGDSPWPIGVNLCVIALLVWTFTITGHAIGVVSTVYAVWATASTSPVRLAWGLGVQAVRLGIILSLGWFGAHYLANTITIGDLSGPGRESRGGPRRRCGDDAATPRRRGNRQRAMHTRCEPRRRRGDAAATSWRRRGDAVATTARIVHGRAGS